jgi:hypothetical protein
MIFMTLNVTGNRIAESNAKLHVGYQLRRSFI